MKTAAVTATATATATAMGVCLAGEHLLDLPTLAAATGVQAEALRLWVEEGLLQPDVTTPQWGFGGAQLARTRRVARLQRDFEANLPALAVMLQLLDEIEALRARLQREGLSLP